MEFGPRSLTRALNSKPTPVRFSVLCSSDEPDTTDRETLRHPCHSLTFTTVTKTARNQITLVITGINQKQEPIESEPTIDRVVLWDNHSWNWAAYLLISDRIRVNASALFFICVLKIPLLKILNVCTFFFSVSCFFLKSETCRELLIWLMSPQLWQSGFYFGNFHASAAMLLFWKAEHLRLFDLQIQSKWIFLRCPPVVMVTPPFPPIEWAFEEV